MGEDAKEILEHHWDTWITEQDWQWLADKGINTVRIPIGFYHICSADPSVIHGTDFADLYDTFSGAWDKITNALKTAHRYGIGVLFDLHAAPGKQNADSHSGTSGEPSFFENTTNMTHTTHILSTFVAHITSFARSQDPPLPNLIGIELLNEPQPGPHNDALKRWYLDAFRAIRSIDPDLPLYISDSWMTDTYAAYIKSTETPFVVLDHHLYRCFTAEDISTTASEHARRLSDPHKGTPDMFSRVAKELESAGGALVVGEWSGALNPGSLHGANDERSEKGAFVRAQLQLYEEHCAGWFFWTYKKEQGGDTGWSFRDAVEAEVFPSDFARICPSIPDGNNLTAAREQTRDQALEQHRSYWSQYPGQYDHQLFYDGFTQGWDDAVLFTSWRPGGASQFAEELGFRGPWVKSRTNQHLAHTQRMAHAWEFEHGLVQGYKDASDYITSHAE
ncbi:glycoside hydrolase [Fomes fomentarius]|nr:glycoside hydrolase [Fomes fomentarius]